MEALMETKEKVKKILTEWQEFKMPKLYERDFDLSFIQSDEILSIIGARRTGKTYLCYQIINSLKNSVPKDNIVYANFEDERLYPLKGNELEVFLDTYFELFHVDMNKKVYLFLDEIQNLGNWSKWARRVADQNKNIKLVLTGSSSKLFSKEIATELRGRTISHTVYPLSFSEYLRARDFKIHEIDKNKVLYSKNRIAIKKLFNDYFQSGGFPAVISSSMPEELLKEYYKTMFYRDLIERYGIKNIKLLEDYLTLVIDQFASLYSISSTAKKLEEFGYSFSKNTLSNFSNYASDIFLIFELRKFSYKVKEQLRWPKKVYAIDHALINAVRFFMSENYGRILENIVFLELKRRGGELYYHSNDKECDFIIAQKNKIVQALQVAKSMTSQKTKDREIEGLTEAMNTYNLKDGFILTEDEADTIKNSGKTITVLPVWYWLLFE
jgi:predicted AAA+ superfamily ATPase